MQSTIARTRHLAAVAAFAVVLVSGCGGKGGGQTTVPPAPTVTTLGRIVAQAPGDGPLTIRL